MLCIKSLHKVIIPLVITLTHLSLASGQTIAPDGLGNFWRLDNNSVKKINSEGKTLANYSNILFGSPNQIDTNDPFRILVFFKDTQTIVALNSDGNIIGKPLQTQDLGFGEITLVCRSNRGGIWLYHRESAELVRLDLNFSQIKQRLPLPFSTNNLQPNHLVSSGGNLYVGMENQMILKLDEYGALIGKIETPYDGTFRVEHGVIILKQGDYLKSYSTKTPYNLKDSFLCPCESLPLMVNNELSCFQGKKFIPCKKNSLEP